MNTYIVRWSSLTMSLTKNWESCNLLGFFQLCRFLGIGGVPLSIGDASLWETPGLKENHHHQDPCCCLGATKIWLTVPPLLPGMGLPHSDPVIGDSSKTSRLVATSDVTRNLHHLAPMYFNWNNLSWNWYTALSLSHIHPEVHINDDKCVCPKKDLPQMIQMYGHQAPSSHGGEYIHSIS